MAISLSMLKKGREIKPPFILHYGVHGIGKSTWAAGASNPIFIQLEEGLNTLDVVKTPRLDSIDQVFEWIHVLIKEEHPYSECVMDSIDHFEGLVHKKVREVYGDAIFTDFGKGYRYSIPYFEQLIEGLTILRDKRNMAIILLGHAKIFQFNSPDQPAYDRYAPDLHESAARYIEECMDCVLFANYKIFVSKEDVGFGKKEGKATGKGDRVVYTQERPPYRAKNRYNLPLELPMSYDAFTRAVGIGLDSMQASRIPSPQESEVAPQPKVEEAPAPTVQ